ncbi:protein FAM151B isoform X2 [Chrysoperla carnea]|nr:protein FAM151B isoform X2 [Chrysoperla carnea]
MTENEKQNTYIEPEANLTKILWAHAVNDKKKLSDALSSNDVDMLEADVVLGVLIDNPISKPFPIMGHPPNFISDLSLEKFLLTVFEFNQNQNVTKGIKLDFKSIDVFEQSLEIINKLYDKMEYPVWINADILSGPIESKVKPVDPDRFLSGAKQFTRSILSIGWTTKYGPDNSNGTYSESNIKEMINVINDNNVTQSITFPVRAGLAAQSFKEILKLIEKINGSTLTIWSSENDPVNVEDLRKLIFAVGLDRTYVDVPEDLRKELHLDQPPTSLS